MSDFLDPSSDNPNQDPASERRSMTRVVIEQFVEVSFDREIFMHASAIDLSLGGLRVQTADRLEPGARIFVLFRLPPQHETELLISAECIVIHCVENGTQWTVGLRFHEISAQDRILIKGLLDSKSS